MATPRATRKKSSKTKAKKAATPKKPRKKKGASSPLAGQRDLPFGDEKVDVGGRQVTGVDDSEGEKLRKVTIGVRLRTSGGTSRSKTLDKADKEVMATAAGMTADGLSGAAKKLFSPKVEAIKALNEAIGAVNKYHASMTRPYVEDGVRLLPKDDIERYTTRITELMERVTQRTVDLEKKRASVLEDARRRLKDKYDPRDYPESFENLVGMRYEFVNLDPPSYLERLHPSVYKQELLRVQKQFNETLLVVENDFLETFQELVSHIVNRTEYVKGGQTEDDGKGGQKEVKRTQACGRIFQESMVGHLIDYIDGFKRLGSTFNAPEELEKMVEMAEKAIADRHGNIPSAGNLANRIRSDNDTREFLHEQFTQVSKELNQFLQDRPRRRIARK